MDSSTTLLNASYASDAATFNSGQAGYVFSRTTATSGELFAPPNITSLAHLPWVFHYLGPIIVASLVLAVLIIDFLIHHCCDIWKELVTFVKEWPFLFIRGTCVFFLNACSLRLNFFIPYWSDDRKLNGGWYSKLDSEYWRMTFWDLLINASLLFLLFLKPLQMETNAGGASPREMFHRMCESYIRFFKIKDFKMLSRKKKWSSIKARASRLLRDWEVIVNAANFLLITYEIDYVFGLNSITNLTHWRFTLPSLQFLRLLCIVWAGDELLGVFRNIPISIAVIFRRTTRIVCCFFCFAAWIQLMEILGDPYTEYNGQKDLTYGKVVAFLYGKLVYLDVISIQLHTTLARISVYVVQAINLLFIAQLIPDMLKQLPNILRLRSFGKVYRKGDKAFVLLLGSVGPNAVEQFAEDFYISNREENILVLLESAASSCATEEMHSVARKHKRNLTVVTGSVFNQADIDKNISDMCRCAFVLANESAPNPEEEDHRNYLSVHVLKQHRSRLRVIVKVLMLHNKDLFYDIPNWSDERNLCSGRPPDRVVCVPEIHFALLAQRHFVPALSSIIHDWLNPSGDETIRSYVIPQDYGEPATRISIRDISTEQTLAGVRSFSPDTANAPTLDDGNAKPLRNLTPNKLSSNASVETNSGESSSPAFKTQDKIATDIVDRNHDNPSEDPSETERLLKKSEADGNKLPAESREDFTPSQSGEKSTDPCDTTNGTKSTSTVEENSKVSRLSPVSDSGGNNSRLQTEPQIPPAATAILTEHQANVQKNHSGVEFKDVKKAYEKLKDGSPFAVLQEGEYHLFPRDNLILGPGTLLFYVKHSRDTGTNNRADVAYNEAAKTAAYRYFEQPPASKNKTEIQIRDVSKVDVYDKTGQYQLNPEDQLYYIDPDKSDQEDRGLSLCRDHIVVCIVSDGSPAFIGLMGFLKPLRAAQIARTTVVILANKKFLDLEAPTINKFSDVLFVQGTPFNDDHLLAVNVQLSRLCVIIDASETTKKLGDDTHPAADTQFPALSKYFNRHGTAVRATSAVAEFIRKHHDRTTTLPENITAAVADIASRIISPSQEASIKESVEASIKEYLLEVRSYDSEYKKTATEKIMKLLRQRDRKHERLIRFIKTLYESSQQWDIGVIEKFVDISIDKRRDASSAETANKVKEVLVNFRNECEHLLEARTPQLLKSCGSEILEDIKGLMRNFRQYVFPSGEIFTCMHHEALDCISWNQNIIGSSKVTVDSSNHSFINAMMIKCYRDVEVFDVIRLLLINGYKNAFHENLSRKISGCPFVGNQAILTQLYAVSKDGTITGFRKRHNADITAERQGIDVQILARQPASTSSAAAAVSGAVRSSPTENFPREGRDVTVHGGDKRPEEIDLPIADVNCSFGTFSEEAMKTGYLVLGTEFPVDKNILMRDMPDGCSLVVLERPWYVAARQRLIKAVMDWWANNGKPEPKRWQRFMEILPSYVLSRTERESGVNIGNPYMDHSPTKWLKAYYGITKDVFNLLNPVTSESEDCGATGENSGKGKALDTSTELKKLPMAIFHFIRETYNNPTADFENKSPGTYYYDTGNDEALKNSHNISWNNILAVCSNGTLTSA